MPFTSRAQQRYLLARHPAVAREFASLPDHASKGGAPVATGYADLARAKREKKRTTQPTEPGQRKISFTPGGLHASLGVARGKKIPPKSFAAAAAGKMGAKAAKQAQFARNVLHHG